MYLDGVPLRAYPTQLATSKLNSSPSVVGFLQRGHANHLILIYLAFNCALEPVQLVMQLYDFTNNDQRWRRYVFTGD